MEQTSKTPETNRSQAGGKQAEVIGPFTDNWWETLKFLKKRIEWNQKNQHPEYKQEILQDADTFKKIVEVHTNVHSPT